METGSRSPSSEFEQRIEALRRIPLEPIDYCNRWVPLNPNKGYRKSCINALTKATGLSSQTVKNWGFNFTRRPQNLPHLLRQLDLLNQFLQLVKTGAITLPPDFPQQ
ncbi:MULTISPECIES: hypothetical protein [unclassified Coleofasciculus]|uniref:hypothetical protein n=1 Tax=Cyanophyceae TaxID=3028117 RepID=UPI001684566E|nr:MULTISPECIES: hypothetical protein [unclassified Coleofasciculus]MBD1836621.1 hypothetical protein [Coleofasciculus sp. FACHB-501]MBD1893162.1 hypothetical protein [Coleofasciculus sp. FACHB-129]